MTEKEFAREDYLIDVFYRASLSPKSRYTLIVEVLMAHATMLVSISKHIPTGGAHRGQLLDLERMNGLQVTFRTRHPRSTFRY